VCAYEPAGARGALRIATVDGPPLNDTISDDYDEPGRISARAIDGAAVSLTYDAPGRVTDETNVLGHFATTYVGNDATTTHTSPRQHLDVLSEVS
jgi:YD repeat-containing protein